jgi:hypothetical protein
MEALATFRLIISGRAEECLPRGVAHHSFSNYERIHPSELTSILPKEELRPELSTPISLLTFLCKKFPKISFLSRWENPLRGMSLKKVRSYNFGGYRNKIRCHAIVGNTAAYRWLLGCGIIAEPIAIQQPLSS